MGTAGRPLNVVSVCRVLPTPDDPSAGVFVLRRLAEIARRVPLRAIQPVPFFPRFKPLPGWASGGATVRLGVVVEPTPMFYLPGAFKSLDSHWMLRAIGTRIRAMHAQRPIDVIDAHFGYPEGVACATLARHLGIPLFVTVRGFEVDFLRRPLIGRQIQKALAAAQGIISVSHSLKRELVARGITTERVHVIHNAIDAAAFRPGDRQQARARLALPASSPLIVSVGRLVSGKRHHELVEALAALRERVGDASLVVIGGPSFERTYPDALRARIDRLGLSGCVRLLGNIAPSEVAVWLHAADIFALATEREGCCNAVLEALAAGLPVVTTPVGDNPEFVTDGENGLLTPVGEIPALASALERALVRRNWDARAIAARLRAQVGDWGNVAERVLEVFGATTNPAPAGSGRGGEEAGE